MKKDFISLSDFSSAEIRTILDLAREARHHPERVPPALKGKSFALIFQKPSNRTRVSFETGIFQLGGNAIYLGSDDINLGKREPTADVARTLSRYVQGIVARVFAHQDILELAEYAAVPVINGLSDFSHPCQAMTDIFTVKENFGAFKGVKMAYIGDGNNMCNSLIVAAAKVGLDLHIATPRGYGPDERALKSGQEIAGETGAVIALTSSPREAARGAHVLYTDTWVSMGQEEEAGKRLKDFEGFQINEELAALADKEHIFMHCLPAHRGQEVTDRIIDGPNSVVFDEAENRLHMQKAILSFLYTR